MVCPSVIGESSIKIEKSLKVSLQNTKTACILENRQ